MYKFITTNVEFEKAITHVNESMSIIGFDTETTGLDPFSAKIIMIQFGNLEIQYVVDVRNISKEVIKKFCELVLSNPKILKVGHNLKFDYKMVLGNYGCRIQNLYDTMITEMVLNCGKINKSFSLAAVVLKYFNETRDKTIRSNFSKIKDLPFSSAEIEYGAQDVIDPLKIKKVQENFLEQNELVKCNKLEQDFVSVLADIEMNGFYVDKAKWMENHANHEAYLKELLLKLDKYVIDNNHLDFIDSQLSLFSTEKKVLINWASSAQVIEYFKFLGIDTKIKDKEQSAKQGFPVFKDTCNAKHIVKFEKEFPIISLYLKYSEVNKQVSTYGESFLKHVNEVTGRIHCDFWQIVDTGRISSRNPNLQNIPATEEYRSCFRAGKNKVLVVCDYSQQEPRITADKSGEPSLIDFYINGDGDSHVCANKIA